LRESTGLHVKASISTIWQLVMTSVAAHDWDI